jgi:excisionase family DNA binding protein
MHGITTFRAVPLKLARNEYATTVRADMAQEMFDVHQLEERFGPKAGTWRKWIAERRIGVVRLGRRVFVAESEVRRFLEQGTIPAKTGSRH